MDKTPFGKIMSRHSMFWGWAFVTPPIVMVVLDRFDRHTPTSVAMMSTFMLIVPYVLCDAFLSKQLTPLIASEESGE